MTVHHPPASAGYPTLDVGIFVSAMQFWNQGQQEPAKTQIQPIADAGNPMAAALLAWFLHQQGEPGWRAAIPYAETAARGGYPQALGFVIGNMLGDPSLRAKAVDLARLAAPYGLNYFDPFNQAISYAQQSDIAGVQAMLSSPCPAPLPLEAEQWLQAVESATASSQAIEAARHEADERRQTLAHTADEFDTFVGTTRANIDSQSTRLKTLITQTTSAQASSFFDSEATAAEGQANTTWNVGIGVVVFAAFLSLLPLATHYSEVLFSHGVALSQSQTLGAHVTAAVALTAVSGVLLTRSRVRDRNRQRNRDLSVALNTMFAYGEQIEDLTERQRFIHDMGRTVIEAYLQQGSTNPDDGLQTILGTLANR